MDWDEWKEHFGLAFHREEDSSRKAVFDANLAFMEAENAKGNQYTLGVNHLLTSLKMNALRGLLADRTALPSGKTGEISLCVRLCHGLGRSRLFAQPDGIHLGNDENNSRSLNM